MRAEVDWAVDTCDKKVVRTGQMSVTWVPTMRVMPASGCFRMSVAIVAISNRVPDKVTCALCGTHILWTNIKKLPNVLSYYHWLTCGTLGLGRLVLFRLDRSVCTIHAAFLRQLTCARCSQATP